MIAQLLDYILGYSETSSSFVSRNHELRMFVNTTLPVCFNDVNQVMPLESMNLNSVGAFQLVSLRDISLYFCDTVVCSWLQPTYGQALSVSIWTSLHWNAN